MGKSCPWNRYHPSPWGEEIARENANFYASRDPFEDMTTFGSRTSPVGFYNGNTYTGYVTSILLHLMVCMIWRGTSGNEQVTCTKVCTIVLCVEVQKIHMIWTFVSGHGTTPLPLISARVLVFDVRAKANNLA